MEHGQPLRDRHAQPQQVSHGLEHASKCSLTFILPVVDHTGRPTRRALDPLLLGLEHGAENPC
jgi:hypothetical protein